jgi:hypothetical protein
MVLTCLGARCTGLLQPGDSSEEGIMEPKELQDAIKTLANMEEADEPLVNCYLDLESRYRQELHERVSLIKGKIEPRKRVSFWEAIGHIEVFIGTRIRPGARSVAIFSRGGDQLFFLPLQVDAPLPNCVTVSATPHIYHLVALKHDCSRFPVEHQKQESLSVAIRLRTEMSTGGRAVGGTFDSFRALNEGRASLLVLSRTYAPCPGWACPTCSALGIIYPMPGMCPACENTRLRELDMREELVRIAEQSNCPVKIVEPSEILKALGGIGCLLRYHAPERLDWPAA